MDVIDRAIENKYHIAKNKALNSQTWQDFEASYEGKKVFYFGVANSAEYFFKTYGDDITLEGIIDNDTTKQGRRVDEFVQEALPSPNGRLLIYDMDMLKQYSSDEIVVLIGSLKRYEEIITELGKIGIDTCFVFLIMEAEKRRQAGKEGEPEQDTPAVRRAFAERCCQNIPVEKKKVFFCSNGTYSDHGKYITEALLRIRQDLDIVWALWDQEAEVPEGVRKIFMGHWKRFVYEIETAGMWLFNVAVPNYITKRQGQFYIQTKHWSSITLKKFYLDADTFDGVSELRENWIRDGQMIDRIVTGSEFDRESCRRGFGFTGEFLPYGSPRTDGLYYEHENREKVFKKYGMDEKKHALLYAPTYRFDKKKGKTCHMAMEIEMDLGMTKNALEETFGGEWYILLRLHPSVANALEHEELPDFAINVSHYHDSQELISASDITISDFSSIMFEPAFVKKPVFLFATDLDDYLENEYELLLDYRALPFPIAESNEGLVEKIKCFDYDQYEEDVTAFLDGYGVHEDGHASDRVAAYISEHIDRAMMR